jgi:aldehyde:ferredoxin oxidoreductase
LASRKIGKGSEQFAMHAGGQELPMHDPRQDPGFALAYVAEPAPGRHTTQSETYYQLMNISKKFRDLKPYPLLSLKSRRYHYDGRGVEHAATSKYMQALSSAGLCMFGALTGNISLEEQIAAATGWEFSADDWMTAGHRVQTVRQLFNVREEVEPGSLRLPGRVLEAQEAGPFKKAFLDVEAMKKGYYRALDWDEETGVPTAACLQSLGIEAAG